MGPATSRSNELLIYNRSGCDVVILYNWKDEVLQDTGLLEHDRPHTIQKLPIGEETQALFRLNIYAPTQTPTVRSDSFQKTSGQNLQVTLTDGSYETDWTLTGGSNQVSVSNQSQTPKLVMVKYAPVETGFDGMSSPAHSATMPVGPLGAPSLRQLGAAPLLDADPPANSVMITVGPQESESVLLKLSGIDVKYDFAVIVMDFVKAHDFETTLVPGEKKKITAVIESEFALNLKEQAPPK